MISKHLAIFGVFLGALLIGQASPAAAQESPCETAHAQWAQAHESLQKAANELREAQLESIESRIGDKLKDAARLTIAQRIQIVLKDRNRRIYEATQKCVDTVDQEKAAFEQLRRCSSPDAYRRSSSHTTLTAIARERNRLLTDLQELLLDEAYVQYKRESPNPPATSFSGYGPDQQSAQYHYPGAARGMGYGGYAPGYGYQ